MVKETPKKKKDKSLRSEAITKTYVKYANVF